MDLIWSLFSFLFNPCIEKLIPEKENLIFLSIYPFWFEESRRGINLVIFKISFEKQLLSTSIIILIEDRT